MTRTPHALLVVACAAVACTSPPPPEARIVTHVLDDTDDTRLGRAVAPPVSAHPGEAGIHALAHPHDAFAARALLADAADKAIDAQYYMWHGDITGTLLFEKLWRAAERGVRVRLLVDDNNTAGLDGTLAALDSHPNLEVRLYNPLTHRRVRALSYALSPRRMNRRMHNKSLTVDNQATVVGGRNVGDEYFGASQGMVFTDLDVLGLGPVVREVSTEFDRYWNSPSAVPAAGLLPEASAEDVRRLESRFASIRSDPEAEEYLRALRERRLVKQLLEGRLTLEWTQAQVVSDDPAKTLDTERRNDLLLLPRMLELMERPLKTMDLVSPYFVPMEDGTAIFQELARSGVRVRVLTNSLAATDVSAVHAGYAKRREALLEAGVQLFELQRAPGAAEGDRGLWGSSSASLHAKTFAVDGARAFVGSFNFDPRSARLNTEMGVVIESPALARGLAEWFDTRVPLLAYEVKRTGDGDLYWVERTESGEKRYDTEPGAGFFLRSWVGFLSLLPIEREL
ncbi:MAG: phospholipase D family protein [Acidobacteria bacterium]|nr:phospholipase D family protein [Acidobacteriota bacterium]